MKENLKTQQSGYISVSLVTSIIFGILSLVFGSVMIWALVNYNDASNNLKSTVAAAVEKAKKEQTDIDQKKFDEDEKQPLKEFVGPNDYGRVSFKYPKTWSVYIDKDGLNGGQYAAYFSPEAVPSVQGTGSKFALRLSILDQKYDNVIQQYAGLVKAGKLRSETISANGFNGQKFEGNISSTIEGTLVVFKIRDKTLVLQTDTPSFRPDFNDKVLKDLSFQQ